MALVTYLSSTPSIASLGSKTLTAPLASSSMNLLSIFSNYNKQVEEHRPLFFYLFVECWLSTSTSQRPTPQLLFPACKKYFHQYHLRFLRSIYWLNLMIGFSLNCEFETVCTFCSKSSSVILMAFYRCMSWNPQTLNCKSCSNNPCLRKVITY